MLVQLIISYFAPQITFQSNASWSLQDLIPTNSKNQSLSIWWLELFVAFPCVKKFVLLDLWSRVGSQMPPITFSRAIFLIFCTNTTHIMILHLNFFYTLYMCINNSFIFHHPGYNETVYFSDNFFKNYSWKKNYLVSSEEIVSRRLGVGLHPVIN